MSANEKYQEKMLFFIPTAYEGAATIKPVHYKYYSTWDKIQTMKFHGPEYVSGLHLCCLQISGKSGLDLQGIEPLTS